LLNICHASRRICNDTTPELVTDQLLFVPVSMMYDENQMNRPFLDKRLCFPKQAAKKCIVRSGRTRRQEKG